MSKQAFVLVHDNARHNAVQAVRDAPHGYCVEIKEASRTIEQNAAQWPYLEGFSQQLMWSVNGELVKLSRDDWKDILSAAFKNETRPRMAAGLNGGVVILGQRTSGFSKRKFSEWCEFLMAEAALNGVTPVYKNTLRETDY